MRPRGVGVCTYRLVLLLKLRALIPPSLTVQASVYYLGTLRLREKGNYSIHTENRNWGRASMFEFPLQKYQSFINYALANYQ